MIGIRDYVVIGYYLIFMIVLGLVFRRFSRNTSDYFRGGGSMLWWMAGPSGIMSALSAWSFTGAAGAIYQLGPLIAVIYLSNVTALLLVLLYSCERFRRMRVVTYAEAIRRRFGAVTEQFYVWVQVPVGIVFAGIALNAVGVFMAAVFGTDVLTTIVTIGAVVIFMAMLGGAWAVVAGDFLQLVLTLLVMVLAVWFTLRMPELGGILGLLERAPAGFFHWGQLMRLDIVILWCIGYWVFAAADFNNMSNGAARFLMVKDGINARRAALVMAGLFLGIAVLLLIPPMAAAVVFPDLQAQYPRLKNPQEAAYVAICLKTMPPGIVGLLVAGIFSVAMAAMDTGLNRNAGVLIRSFYLRYVRPRAANREQMIASKLCTLALGLIVVGVACAFSRQTGSSLFSLTQAAGSLLGFPLAVPMVLGIFVRRAPPWAGWSTALVGVVTAAFVEYGALIPLFTSWAGWLPLSVRESVHLGFALRVLSVVVVAGLWFWFVRRYAPRLEDDPAAEFFRDVDRPIDNASEGENEDYRQYRTMGLLCVTYGGGIALLSLMPNRLAGHLAFLFCGGAILAIGAVLLWRGARLARCSPTATSGPGSAVNVP